MPAGVGVRCSSAWLPSRSRTTRVSPSNVMVASAPSSSMKSATAAAIARVTIGVTNPFHGAPVATAGKTRPPNSKNRPLPQHGQQSMQVSRALGQVIQSPASSGVIAPVQSLQNVWVSVSWISVVVFMGCSSRVGPRRFGRPVSALFFGPHRYARGPPPPGARGPRATWPPPALASSRSWSLVRSTVPGPLRGCRRGAGCLGCAGVYRPGETPIGDDQGHAGAPSR